MNLSRLIGKLDALAAGSFLDGVKREVAAEGLKLTAACFGSSQDPYGVTWPALKHPRPGGPVEVKTGAMRDGMLAGPVPEGIRFYATAGYAGYQHHGTATIPQRRLLPVGYLGIPDAWKGMIERVFQKRMRTVSP